MNLYRTAAVVTLFSAFEHTLGFLYRMILSRTLGPEGLGVYQVALSVFAVFLTVCSSGLPITLSRTLAKHRAARRGRENAATTAAVFIALFVSLFLTVLLFLLKKPFSRVFSDPRCADLFYILLLGLSFCSVYAVIRGSFWGNKRFFAYSLIELIEEIVMLAVGVFLLLFLHTEIADVNLAAIAVLVSYLFSFAAAAVYFGAKGGRLQSPKGEFLPLLKSSLPVTVMRTSSSLVNSLISVVFPLRLMAAGMSSSRAMSEYGVIGGMVMPILMTPCTLISSIALVLVPELSETYYQGDRAKLSALVKKAFNATVLIAAALIPFFAACGEGLGVLLFASSESGKLIADSAIILIPMSITMISTSMLNSMGCEKHTLLFFLFGAAAMLLCVWFLPKTLGASALLVGMGCNYTLSALLSLFLLVKKTGRIHSGRYCLVLALAAGVVTVLGVLLRRLLMRVLSYLPALIIVILFLLLAELVLFSALKLFSPRALLAKFFGKRKSRRTVHAAT